MDKENRKIERKTGNKTSFVQESIVCLLYKYKEHIKKNPENSILISQDSSHIKIIISKGLPKYKCNSSSV